MKRAGGVGRKGGEVVAEERRVLGSIHALFEALEREKRAMLGLLHDQMVRKRSFNKLFHSQKPNFDGTASKNLILKAMRTR